jgi:hypothetical protein
MRKQEDDFATRYQARETELCAEVGDGVKG